MADEDLRAELERLRKENEALKQAPKTRVTMKVSDKGGLSVYGLAIQSARPARKSSRRNSWRDVGERGKVERGAGEDRYGNGAYCPRVSVVLGCVIDIGEPIGRCAAGWAVSRLRE